MGIRERIHLPHAGEGKCLGVQKCSGVEGKTCDGSDLSFPRMGKVSSELARMTDEAIVADSAIWCGKARLDCGINRTAYIVQPFVDVIIRKPQHLDTKTL